eukprot:SAG31_NODE_3102_length_4673_cov_2.821382_4_plen_549_part_00
MVCGRAHAQRAQCSARDLLLHLLGPGLRTRVMNSDELFSFDVQGFFIVRGAVSAALAENSPENDPQELQAAVLASPALQQYVATLMLPGAQGGDAATGVLLDRPLEMLPQVPAGGQHVLLGDGDSLYGGERRWVQRIGSGTERVPSVVRYAQGLRIVVALADCPAGAGGLHVVPASHNSSLPRSTPCQVLLDDELCVQPSLAAGDCLLMAANLVSFLRPWTSSSPQQLMCCELITPQTRSVFGIPPVASGPGNWHDCLTPLEKVVSGVEGLDDDSPIVISDGTKAWLSPPPPTFDAYLAAGGMAPDPLELYKWDLRGVLHLTNVLSPSTVERALAAIEARNKNPDSTSRSGVGKVGDPIGWANGHGAPFREMMTSPAVLARLAWMQGFGSYNNSRSLFCWERGEGGQGIHGDPTATGPHAQYHNYDFLGSRVGTRTGSINVAFQLMDVDETDGGVVYIPGGHKSSIRLPKQLGSHSSNHDPDGLFGVVRPHLQAGDAFFFMGGASPHGSQPYPLSANHPRRAVLMNFLGRGITLRDSSLPRLQPLSRL